MSAGVPAVVMAGGGAEEAVGSAGLVVSPGDTHGLEAALRRLASSAEERAAVGHAARNRVAQHYRDDEMIEQTRNAYAHAIRGAARA